MGDLSFVSLFSGAGGLDLGLEDAGWQCRYASDIDETAVSSLRTNAGRRLPTRNRAFLDGAHVEATDVRELTGDMILSRSGGLSRGDLQLLAGGPPCQSWSSAGHQRGLDDPRGKLISDFARLANEMDVRWLLFENVRGLLTARGLDGRPGSALEMLRRCLLDYGFQTTVTLLNGADYGVAQRRVRLFIAGYRSGDEPVFPAPTHTRDGDGSSALLPWKTLGECVLGLDPLSEDEVIRASATLARQLSALKPGTGIKSPGKKETTRPGGHWGYKQGAFVADMSLPSRTITASGQQDWIIDPALGLRRLCPRECAAIQSFPEWWQWDGSRSTQYRLIGNAVPPKLASAVGAQLASHCSTPSLALATDRADLRPLPPVLEAAIRYTQRDEARNGASRKAAPLMRKMRQVV
jgi:DNA (cytosine-5)-methyltransferase 1